MCIVESCCCGFQSLRHGSLMLAAISVIVNLSLIALTIFIVQDELKMFIEIFCIGIVLLWIVLIVVATIKRSKWAMIIWQVKFLSFMILKARSIVAAKIVITNFTHVDTTNLRCRSDCGTGQMDH